MAELVYILCALTSSLCAVLLFRGFRHNQTRLLFWSGLCFAGLAMNNAILLVDLLIVPDVNLESLRVLTAVASMIVLLVGLVWEGR